MGNRALQTNAGVFRHANLQITRRGSDWYFTVCALMGAATIAFLATGLRRHGVRRLFHWLLATATFVSTIAYYAMGSNLGQVPIRAEWQARNSQTRSAGTREVFYVRYIDWFVTSPLLLLSLLLVARLPWWAILTAVLCNWIAIVCGLVGALVFTRYKWGFYVFGVAALLFLLWIVLRHGGRYASSLSGARTATTTATTGAGTSTGEAGAATAGGRRGVAGGVGRVFWPCAGLLSLLWCLYPISWALSEGANVIHPDSEAIFYGILDIFAKAVFGGMLLFGLRNIDPYSLGLHSYEPGATTETVKDGAAPMAQHAPGNGVETGQPATTAPQYTGVSNGAGARNV